MPYRLLIAIEVIEFIERLSAKPRTLLRKAIRKIGDDPLGCSEATEYDETGRTIHITIVDDFALMYWIDDADRHIKILDIHSADR